MFIGLLYDFEDLEFFCQFCEAMRNQFTIFFSVLGFDFDFVAQHCYVLLSLYDLSFVVK